MKLVKKLEVVSEKRNRREGKQRREKKQKKKSMFPKMGPPDSHKHHTAPTPSESCA